jgi:lycopene beta-cyclase
MDAVLLRALDSGRLDGAAFFTDLFDRHPVERVLRFLDGASSPREELASWPLPRGPRCCARPRRWRCGIGEAPRQPEGPTPGDVGPSGRAGGAGSSD